MKVAIFTALTAAACLVSLAAAFYAAHVVKALRDYARRFPRSAESRMSSLETSLADTQEALTDLTNRVKMMRVRTAANHPGAKGKDTMPDPYRDPEAWRAAMNRRMAGQRMNGLFDHHTTEE